MVKTKYWAGKAASYVLPSGTLRSDLDCSGISRRLEVIGAYQEDPLVHDRIALRTARDLLDGGRRLRALKAATLSVPLFLAHGDADRITR